MGGERLLARRWLRPAVAGGPGGAAARQGGRRGAGNAFANCGIAALAAVAAVTTPHRDAAWLAFVAALTAGGSDTVASEIGKAWGKSTFLVTNLGRVKPGTPGAMSLEGTTAGIVAAAMLALVAVALGQITAAMVLAVVIGATAGALVESMLGATLEVNEARYNEAELRALYESPAFPLKRALKKKTAA